MLGYLQLQFTEAVAPIDSIRSNKDENNFREQLYSISKAQSLEWMVQGKGLYLFDAHVQTEIELLYHWQINRKHKLYPISVHNSGKHPPNDLESYSNWRLLQHNDDIEHMSRRIAEWFSKKLIDHPLFEGLWEYGVLLFSKRKPSKITKVIGLLLGGKGNGKQWIYRRS